MPHLELSSAETVGVTTLAPADCSQLMSYFLNFRMCANDRNSPQNEKETF